MFILLIIIVKTYIICKKQSLFYNFSILPAEKEFTSQLLLKFISNTDICIGTPLLCKTIQFVPNTYFSFFLDSQSKRQTSSNTTYNSTASSSLRYVIDFWYGFFDEVIHKGRIAIDQVSFGSLTLEHFFFYLAIEYSSVQDYSIIGLSFDFRQNIFPSFIKQLANNFIVNRRQYTIEFNNETNGRIIFGNDSDRINHQLILKLSLAQLLSPGFHYYTVNNILIGERGIIIAKDVDIIFDEAFGFIQLGIEMKQIIIDNFLIDLNCIEEIIAVNQYKNKPSVYMHFICDKKRIKVEYDKGYFKDLVFSFDGGDLILTKDELFNEYDTNKMRFAIIVTEKNVSPQWVIGWPILKKYRISHDYDDKTIAFYSNENILNRVWSPQEEQPNKTTIIRFNVFIWIDIELIIGLVVNGILFMKFKLKK